MATNIRYQEAVIQITASGNYVSGTPVKVGTALYGVPLHTAASGEQVAILVSGVADLPKTGGAGVIFALGDKVYWDGSVCTLAATDSLIGVATAAATNAATTVEVRINGEVVSQADADAIAAAFGGGTTAVGLAKVLSSTSLGIHRCNFAATGAPTANDDLDLGYHVGSLWFDITNAKMYVCNSAANGAAAWNQIDRIRSSGTLTVANAATTGTAAVGTAFNGKSVLATIKTKGANAVGIAEASVAAGTLTVTVTGDPGVGGCTVAYAILDS